MIYRLHLILYQTIVHLLQATSHPLQDYISFTTCYISSTSRLYISSSTRLQYISSTTTLLLIHYQATSHPLYGYILSTTRLHLIFYQPAVHLIRHQTPFHPLPDNISSTIRLHLIHYQATSHPLLAYKCNSSTTRLHLIHCQATSINSLAKYHALLQGTFHPLLACSISHPPHPIPGHITFTIDLFYTTRLHLILY